jgi:hypothetical protein
MVYFLIQHKGGFTLHFSSISILKAKVKLSLLDGEECHLHAPASLPVGKYPLLHHGWVPNQVSALARISYRSEMATEIILTRVGVTYKPGSGLDLMHRTHSQLETTGNTATLLIYTLYSSLLHAR